MPCPELSLFAHMPQTPILITRRHWLLTCLCKRCFLAAVRDAVSYLFYATDTSSDLRETLSPYLLLWRRCILCSVPSWSAVDHAFCYSAIDMVHCLSSAPFVPICVWILMRLETVVKTVCHYIQHGSGGKC